jgi:hypothetical protein
VAEVAESERLCEEDEAERDVETVVAAGASSSAEQADEQSEVGNGKQSCE